MVQSRSAVLDTVFGALSDPTRRAVIESLSSSGSLPVTELAHAYDMSLTGFMKHLRVLQDAGLIACAKEGRIVRCALSAKPMQEAAVWLSRYEKFWTGRLDALGRFLHQAQEMTPWQAARPKNGRRSPLPEPSTRRPKKSGARGPTRKT